MLEIGAQQAPRLLVHQDENLLYGNTRSRTGREGTEHRRLRQSLQRTKAARCDLLPKNILVLSVRLNFKNPTIFAKKGIYIYISYLIIIITFLHKIALALGDKVLSSSSHCLNTWKEVRFD